MSTPHIDTHIDTHITHISLPFANSKCTAPHRLYQRHVSAPHYMSDALKLNSNEIGAVARAMTHVAVAEGKCIVEKGAPENYFHVLTAGRASCSGSASSPSELVVQDAGWSFGNMALLYDSQATLTVRAYTDCEFWRLTRSKFRSVLRDGSRVGGMDGDSTLARCRWMRSVGKSVPAVAGLLHARLEGLARRLEISTYDAGSEVPLSVLQTPVLILRAGMLLQFDVGASGGEVTDAMRTAALGYGDAERQHRLRYDIEMSGPSCGALGALSTEPSIRGISDVELPEGSRVLRCGTQIRGLPGEESNDSRRVVCCTNIVLLALPSDADMDDADAMSGAEAGGASTQAPSSDANVCRGTVEGSCDGDATDATDATDAIGATGETGETGATGATGASGTGETKSSSSDDAGQAAITSGVSRSGDSAAAAGAIAKWGVVGPPPKINMDTLTIHGRLGQGSFGEVLLAENNGAGESVYALKKMSKIGIEDMRQVRQYSSL